MIIHDYELNDDLYKITLAGRLDIATVAQITDSFTRMCESPRKGIIIDLTEVTYIASMGIRLLLIGCKAVNSRGGRIVMVVPRQEIKNVLVISGLHKIMEVFDDLDSAVASFE